MTRFPVEKSGAARIGGGERSEPVSRIVFMSYDTESKSRNVLASPLGEEGHEVAKGCTRVRMIMILDVDVTAERRHYNTHCPPKGETTHYILRVASAPSKCVRCAPKGNPQPFEPACQRQAEPSEPSEPSCAHSAWNAQVSRSWPLACP